ncbi:alpha/beta fold hydrolase [Mycobacterium europaeum]|uniref:alpha/beta fold hydrolase n=1 Tax=Mycobacterium europaeum TaxID=761804 RepID=UPI002ADFDC58|nr:alpha/beta fold hydrolase [Mycobacterium europaeum]MEA1161881.1 alpha/beta fold hydrolase [Mycobacterium europaeum]
MRRRFVAGPAGRLSCLWAESGSARTPLVFVHGINGVAEQWSPVARLMAGRGLLAVDLRGHGDSAPGGRYEAADYAADVSAAMSALGITRAHLVGASFGAGVCVTLAATEPDRAASLTLIGGALSVAGTADAEAAVAELRRLGAESFFEQAAAASFGPDADEEMLRQSVRLAAFRDEAVIERILRAALAADVSAAAARATAPARVLTGEHDRTCPPELGAALATALRTDCMVLAGLGHMAHIEDPHRIAALLEEHICRADASHESPAARGS